MLKGKIFKALFIDLLLALAFFCIVSQCVGQEVKLNLPKHDAQASNLAKYAGIGLILLGSAADGMVEGFDFDSRTSFERKGWTSNQYGFFGSQSWATAYVNNDVKQGLKPGFTKWFGSVDFYHVADDVRKYGYLTGSACFTIGQVYSKKKIGRKLLETGIVIVASSLTKKYSMQWIRN